MNKQAYPVLFPAKTTSICLKTGQYLEDGSSLLRVDALDNNKVVLRDVQTNETRVTTDYHVISAIHDGHINLHGLKSRQLEERFHISGNLQKKINIRQESNVALEKMLIVKAWLDELKNKGLTRIEDNVWVRGALTEIGKTTLAGVWQPCIQTLIKAKSLVERSNGDWSLLIPRYSERGGMGRSRLDPRVEAIISQNIEELKNSKSIIVKNEVYQKICTEVFSLNIALPNEPLQTPGQMTINRRIAKAIPQIELVMRTSSKRYVKDQYRRNAFPREKTKIPLLISEYDDLDAGIYLVNNKTRMPVGRAHITHGICRATGVPLGYDISHESRSYDSAMGAIADSLLPKDMTLPQYANCEFPWDGYGVQGTIYLDNARYNKSKAIDMQSQAAEILLTYTKPRGPTEKQTIEYFNSILESDFCKRLPGWCGKKDDPDGVKVGVNSAFMDIDAFQRLGTKWCTDVYMNKPGFDGNTPRQRWQNYYKNFKPSVRWPREEVALFRLKPEMLTFRDSGGLARLRLPYDNDQLQDLRKLLGHKAEVLTYSDRKAVSYILVRNPFTKEVFRVNCCLDPRYTKDLTEAQHQWILKECSRKKIKNPALKDLVNSRASLSKLVEDERISGKMRRRKFAQNIGNVTDVSDDIYGKDKPEAARIVIVEGVISNLEWEMMQLEEVPLDLADPEWGIS